VILPEWFELDHSPESYQRLVSNPFLGILGVIGWLMGMTALFVHGVGGAFTPMATLLLLASLALIPGLFQYHCLDCGATGRLSDWRRHMCPRVAERRLEGRNRRIHGPTPPVQVILWLWILMALILLVHSLGFRLPTRSLEREKPPEGKVLK
jgi:hypothetical protein